jgi:ribokinase
MTVIKMGPDGSLVHDAQTDRIVDVGVAAGPVVDVTGAGDAFCGSFAAGLVIGDTPADAARRGAAGASIAVEAFGTLHEWSRTTAAARLREILPGDRPAVASEADGTGAG